MIKNGNRVAIQESYELPSRGAIYSDINVPPEVTLRAMTTMEEKMRLSGTGMNVIPNIIKACVVEPENLDTNKLKLFDLQFLMYKLRIVTYGPDYKLSLRCPNCGKKSDFVIDLDSIPVNYAGESFKEPFTIGPLPVSKDLLECVVLTSQDYIDIEREARKIKSKFPDYVGDPEFILGYKYRISKINGETLPDGSLQQYIEDMNAKDMRYLDSEYSKLTDGIGMDLDMIETCPSCGEEIEFTLPVTSEFFRPTY